MTRGVGVAEVWEGESVVVTDYLLRPDGTILKQANVHDIAYSVTRTDSSGKEEVLDDAIPLDKTAVIFDTAQTDGYRRRDSRGYTFKHALEGDDLFDEGGYVYHVSYVLATDDGLRRIACDVTVKAIKGVP